MPLPLLYTLSQAARAAFPVIQRAVREGLSSRRLEEALRAAGQGVRRSDLLAAMRIVRGATEGMPRLANIRRDSRPDPARLPEAITKTRREYTFIVEVRGYDVRSGEPVSRHVTVSSSHLPTRGEIEDEALDMAGEGGDRYGIEAESAVLVSGFRAGSQGLM